MSYNCFLYEEAFGKLQGVMAKVEDKRLKFRSASMSLS